jgi:hypothetical protein
MPAVRLRHYQLIAINDYAEGICSLYIFLKILCSGRNSVTAYLLSVLLLLAQKKNQEKGKNDARFDNPYGRENASLRSPSCVFVEIVEIFTYICVVRPLNYNLVPRWRAFVTRVGTNKLCAGGQLSSNLFPHLL